jgi:hypothetical protein
MFAAVAINSLNFLRVRIYEINTNHQTNFTRLG